MSWNQLYPSAATLITEPRLLHLDCPPFGLRAPEEVETRRVLAAIARGLAPRAAPDPPPEWLRPAQREAFQRVLGTVRRYHGCLLAEPVGTGKTWIALAVAWAFAGEATCIVPSVLKSQWASVGRAAGIKLTLTTHEQWSRGPRILGPGLVVVDESHRFRMEKIRRVGHLAPALTGRAGLLLTATPVVNRLADLVTQLLFFVRDDALATKGVKSLRESLSTNEAPTAIRDLIVSGTTRADGLPRKASRCVPYRPAGEPPLLVHRIDRLHLAASPAVRTLLQGMFALAESSSPLALVTVLENYRLLLLQRRDADRNGRGPSRATIRRLLLGELEQLVLWDLLQPDTDDSTDLTPADLPLLEDILREAKDRIGGRNSKTESLQDILSDGRPSVVFVRARATVDYLRGRLSPRARVAWCTGSGAGIGSTPLPRESVLGWFRPGERSATNLAPSVLVTTDVSSEGLDLQYASRIVHYDLPWTHARLDQRVGRARRLNTVHREVEVVAFQVPPELEARIGLLEALRQKSTLPGRIGLRPASGGVRTGRAPIVTTRNQEGPVVGSSLVQTDKFRILLGVRFLTEGMEISNLVLVQDRKGCWHTEQGAVESALVDAGRAAASTWEVNEVRRALAEADGVLSRLVQRTAGYLWHLRSPSPGDRRAFARLSALARAALTRRDGHLLALLDRGFSFVRRGHTLGEQDLVRRIGLAAGEAALCKLLRTVTAAPDPMPPIRVELKGVICASSLNSRADPSDGFPIGSYAD